MSVLTCLKPIPKVNLVPRSKHNTAFWGFTRVNNKGERNNIQGNAQICQSKRKKQNIHSTGQTSQMSRFYIIFLVGLVSATPESNFSNVEPSWGAFEKIARSETTSLIRRLLPHLLRSVQSGNVSEQCETSLMSYAMGLSKWKDWPVLMADASGKLPGGVLEGTILDFGSYEECLRIRVNDTSTGKERFRGRYCMIGYQSPLLAPLNQKTPNGKDYIDAYGKPPKWVSRLMAKSGPYVTRAAFWFGTCVPSACSDDDVKQISTSVSKPLGLNVKLAGCEIDEPLIWPASAFISVCVLCILLVICILGTVLDVVIRNLYDNESEPNFILLQILRAFSLYTNTKKLFAISSNKDTLGCFHGIRFFSAVWIILGHTYFFTDTWKYLKYRDVLVIDDLFNYYLPAAILENFTIPVGSFFFMSGFLLVYSTWKKLEKSDGKLNVFMFIFHKYWRMTPALAFMIAAFLVLPIISSGPLWNSTLDPPVNACERHWWTNLLYINNFWDSEDYCLIHTWYLAALMQFHIIGIIILLLSFRWPGFGIFLGLTIVIGSCIITALLTIWNNFPMPTPAINKDLDVMEAYNSIIYIKPFCHAPTYLIGMAVAHLVLKYKDKKIGLGYQIVGWFLAIIGALSSVYGIYGPSESVEIRAFYLSCYRLGWTASIGWLAFVCITGKGGIVNSFLSWNAFVSLGQLSYLVYLLHPLIMLYKTASLRERITYGHNELVFEFLTYTVIAFLLAYIGHTAVEKPFLTLEGIFFRNKAPGNVKIKNSKEPVMICGVKTINP
ncbi:nose resistant to fluoxetine protein 6 [Trichonephila clavipes]|uniref:Nose resistant to fluoxetine protein 6 n=1 Tax=Trichonephila clavipes TaxID=2585209 RepID=A0A8X6WJ03_TRICX|nr:nose resistant to fluoxetine protein 6 [Trichonephila clavipes]